MLVKEYREGSATFPIRRFRIGPLGFREILPLINKNFDLCETCDCEISPLLYNGVHIRPWTVRSELSLIDMSSDNNHSTKGSIKRDDNGVSVRVSEPEKAAVWDEHEERALVRKMDLRCMVSERQTYLLHTTSPTIFIACSGHSMSSPCILSASSSLCWTTIRSCSF